MNTALPKQVSPWWFAYVVLATLAYALVLLPPFQAADESAHLGRAIALAKGQSIIGLADVRPLEVPASLAEWQKLFPIAYFGCDDTGQCWSSAPFDISATWKWVTDTPRHEEQTYYYGWAGAAMYPPLSHAAAALGVWVAGLADANIAVTFFSARLFNAVSCLAICLIAFLVAGPARVMVLVILLFPSMLGSMAAISADGILNALALLTLATSVRFLNAGPVAFNRANVALLVGTTLTSFVKFGYFLLPLLPLLAAGCGPRATKRTRVLLAVLFAATAIGGAVYVYIAGAGDVTNEGADVGTQVRELVLAPWRFIPVFFDSLAKNGFAYASSIVGYRSWGLNYGSVLQWPMLALAAFVAWRVALRIPRDGRFIFVAVVVVLATIMIPFGILYLIWTPVGAAHVVGMQGRYLLPALIVLPLALPYVRREVAREVGPASDGWILAVAAFLHLVLSVETAYHYYT